jgi:hypothetical protein
MKTSILHIFLVAHTVKAARGHSCFNGCSGHGFCTTTISSCQCFAGWQGNDCSERVCPTGYPWSGEPTATDTLRSAEVECANAGSCDRSTGQCNCDLAFTGFACERLKCPNACNGHGVCTSLKNAAATKNGRNLVLTPTTYDLWDADRVYGCVCDHGYEGYDCSLKSCPLGIDPLNYYSAVMEVQTWKCDNGAGSPISTGSFTFTFKGHSTIAISADSSTSTTDVANALKELPTITDVTVTFHSTSGSLNTWCSSAGYARITFTRELGNQPDMIAVASLNGPTLVLQSVGGDPNTQSVVGIGSFVPCNNRGLCDYAKGSCSCQGLFSSSSGSLTNAAGNAGNCGYYTTAPSSCAGSTSCSGHGICSGASNFECSCYEGWTAYDCSIQTCPTGKAWWDEPTSANVAHGMIECSGRGLCTNGKCVCQAGYEGASCERISCPLDTSLGYCSGAGQCMSTAEQGLARTQNGVSAPVVYGSDLAAIETWDAHKIMSCKCDGNMFQKYELAARKGFTCSEHLCVTGDNPTIEVQADGTSSQSYEIQTVQCAATGGSFTLSFRGETTIPLSYDFFVNGNSYLFEGVTATVTFGSNAFVTSSDQSTKIFNGDIVTLSNTGLTDIREFTVTAISTITITVSDYIGMPSGSGYSLRKTIRSVETALEALSTIRNVSITSFAASDGITSANAPCSASPGNYMHITFFEDFGDLPPLTATVESAGPSLTIIEATAGSKENLECSGRGKCDRTTGLCSCFSGATSSNGFGLIGTRGDCGYSNPHPLFEGE